jgi:class 3 adenylate cyclase
MVERNAAVAREKRIEFRVGINVGDTTSDGDDIFGDGANVAARLEGIAEPGDICLSEVAYVQRAVATRLLQRRPNCIPLVGSLVGRPRLSGNPNVTPARSSFTG